MKKYTRYVDATGATKVGASVGAFLGAVAGLATAAYLGSELGQYVANQAMEWYGMGQYAMQFVGAAVGLGAAGVPSFWLGTVGGAAAGAGIGGVIDATRAVGRKTKSGLEKILKKEE